ncbi:MAG: D-cysteine desulfhydrase, partial [Alphaproteobacteria bacterium]|nr:D-cysteine desulfhydrase [Alphaproteobacteria bacterium]
SPRVSLGHLPTPLEYLPRLSAHLGGPRILVKRDDCTGLALGGNKTRKLEFLMAEAQAQGADTVLTTGGVQSNHVRQTAAACARMGLSCHLVLARAVPWDDPAYETSGNVQLDHLLGAQVHLLPHGTDRDGALARMARTMQKNGKVPYVIPSGGSNATGALGYVACAEELEAQAKADGEHIDYLIHATGSGGTQAGLIAGFQTIASQIQVLGIDITAHPADLAGKVSAIAKDTLKQLGNDVTLSDDAQHIIEGYAGSAYGMPTEEMRAAVRLAARLEGLILDPVYSGKAMAGLIDLVAQGRFRDDQTIAFLHTGGMPGLFAYTDYFQED